MDCVLELLYSRDGAGLHLDPTYRDQGRVRSLGRRLIDPTDGGQLEKITSAFTSSYERSLREADHAGATLGNAPAVTELLRQELIPVARELGRLLLPAGHIELQRRLRQLRDNPTPRIEIRIDLKLQGVPFEAMWWEDDFLGFRFAVSRRLPPGGLGQIPDRIAPESSDRRRPRCTIVADPGSLLGPAAARMKDTFEELLFGWGESRRPNLELHRKSCRISNCMTRDDLDGLVRGHEVVVLLAHHEPGAENAGPGKAGSRRHGLQLGPSSFYCGADLRRAMLGGELPWLLCLPCCHSGVGRNPLGRVADGDPGDSSLLAAALGLGIPQYIGTTFEVHAEFVSRVIGPLLRHLDEGQSIGEALRLARRSLRSREREDNPEHPGSLPGLALQLVGDGGAALVSAEGHRLDHDHPRPSRVHWCEESGMPDRRWCGRAISPREAGHASHRCVVHHRPIETSICSAGHRTTLTQLVTCGRPGCGNTYCPSCRTRPFSRCWCHATDEELLVDPAQGVRCIDPHGLHPNEPRMIRRGTIGCIVHRQGPLCRECLDAERQGLAKRLKGGG